jgi:serine phosphatase RsbU (regulator of sigma subunit)
MRALLFIASLLWIFSATGQTGDRETDSLETAARSADPEEAIQARTTLVVKFYSSGNLGKAKKLMEETRILAERHGSARGLGAVYNTRGILFYYQSEFDSAFACFEKSLELRTQAGDREGMLKTIGNLGSMKFMQMDYPAALSRYEEALKLEADLGYREGTVVSVNNIAQVYHAMRVNTRALAYFRKAEKIYLAGNNTTQLAFTYDGLSSVYEDLGRNDSALFYGLKSKELAEKSNDLSGVAYAMMNLGILYHKLKKDDLAISTYNEALRRAVIMKDKRLQLGIYGNLAGLYIEKNDLDGALLYIEKLIPLQQELKDEKVEGDLARVFAEYYYRKKDYKRAFDHMMHHDRVRDSVYDIETAAKITEMQEKYQNEKKEKENQLLQSENRSYRITRNYLAVILALALIAIGGAIVAYRKIMHSRSVISAQKELVDEKQKEILDSIHYAKRIQYALLASDSLLKAHLPEYFVFFRPKDVVSGDFYWATPGADGFILVTGDCTGHGVPGAFMSLLNITKLNKVISEDGITRPDLILNHVRSEIIRAVNPEGSSEESKDGMDAVVCKLNTAAMKLEYAAANNSFHIVRNGHVLTCKADKMPVGKDHNDGQPFTYNEIKLEPGDTIYTFTDGFADQFGGMLGKKFKYQQFEELLLRISAEDMATQKKKLSETFDKWKGNLEQVDDVCVIGIRV